jgi:UDP-N-acetylmuramoyl-tripeptide--D-alanyl-D-alanine ligase
MRIPRIDAVRALRADTFDVPDDLAPLHVVTDTRAIAAGDTFLALRGERFDGHAFVAQARERGAVAAIVADADARVPGMPTFVVRDTLAAYMALAAVARDALDDPIVAITGSTGKTTTKAFAAQVLALVGRTVFATPENENNEIGASKFFLAQEPVRGVRVVEMGMRHPGDIAALVRLARPTVAVVTNVGDAHLGEMGSHAAIEREKYSILDGGARAIVNASDATARVREPSLREPWWFAADPDVLPANGDGVALHDSHALVVRRGADIVRLPVHLAVPGRHNRANLAAACAVALALGTEPAAIAAQLHAIRLPNGRFERIELASGAAIVYDAYNASPAGMCAALEAFAESPAARHIAVLASMRELGPDAPAMHADVGAAAAAAKPERLFVGGEFADDLARGARDAGYPATDIVTFRDNADCAALLAATMRAGDLALLKGSRYYAMEHIVTALQEASAR